MKPLAIGLLLGLALVGVAGAQMTLTTTFAAGNGQQGNMFDIVATNQVTICYFDVNIAPGTYNLEVYTVTGGGSFVGNETNAGAWTLAGSAAGVVSAGTGVPTQLPILVNTTINAGATQGFYVTLTTAGTMWYTNGTALGAVFVSDPNIQFLQGVGKSYPFGSTFSPRIWNGNIHYNVGPVGCAPFPAPPYQVNQANANLAIDGVQGTTATPAITTLCTGQVGTLTTSSANPAPWDLGVNLSPLIPNPPGIVTPNQQVVNINLLPSTIFLNGLTFAVPFVPLNIPLASAAPLTASAQMIVLDASNADGFSLSQGVQLEVTAGAGGSLPGPVSDDSAVQINFGGAPLCGAAVPFMGTSFTQAFVISNGRVMFGAAANTSFTPTVTVFQSDNPSVGLWTDLNPGVGGTITATSTATSFTAAYSGLAYFGGAAGQASFTIDIDIAGVVTIGGLSVLPNPAALGGGDAQILGISGGNLIGATNPGSTAFSMGGSGSNAAATDMIYEFWDGLAATAPNGINLLASLQGGMTSLVFTPTGPPGAYTWAGL